MIINIYSFIKRLYVLMRALMRTSKERELAEICTGLMAITPRSEGEENDASSHPEASKSERENCEHCCASTQNAPGKNAVHPQPVGCTETTKKYGLCACRFAISHLAQSRVMPIAKNVLKITIVFKERLEYTASSNLFLVWKALSESDRVKQADSESPPMKM